MQRGPRSPIPPYPERLGDPYTPPMPNLRTDSTSVKDELQDQLKVSGSKSRLNTLHPPSRLPFKKFGKFELDAINCSLTLPK